MKGDAAAPSLSLLRDVTRGLLQRQLGLVSGGKPFDLIMDGSLMRPLDRLVQGATFFKKHGAERIFKLEEKMSGDVQRIYVIRPTVSNIRLIIGHVSAAVAKLRSSPTTLPIKTIVMFVPRKSFVCDKLLEEEGVYGHVILEDLKLDLIPFDEDIISMELPLFFKDVFLDNDLFWLHSAAGGLLTLQKVFGEIPNSVFIGSASCDVQKILASLKANDEASASSETSFLKAGKSGIHTAIVFDRNLDLVTPMLTQITYEGMLDETFGISCGMIEFPEEVAKTKSATKMLLTNDDPIYKEVRNRHFTNVFGFLKHKAKTLQSDFERRKDISSVGEMKEFVGNQLKNLTATHKALAVHISACEGIITRATGPDGEIEDRLKAEHTVVDTALDAEVIAYIEDHLALQSDQLKILRLMCLCSAVSDGLRDKDYASLKTQFLQAHGFDHLPLFHSLTRSRLFYPDSPTDIDTASSSSTPSFFAGQSSSSILSGASFKSATSASIKGATSAMTTPFFGATKSSTFFKLSAKLKLVPKDREIVDLKNPTSMSYIYSGAYSPLSCSVVEELVTRGYDLCKETLDMLTPDHSATTGAVSARVGGGSSTSSSLPSNGASVLVYFLGGVTFAEIAALRFLGKVRGLRFIVATTAIINGDTLIESIAND